MLAVVTNDPGWRVACPAFDLEKAPDADWPLYPTTLPVLPVMFGPNISGSIKPFGVACSDFVATGALSGGKSSTPWNGKTNVGSNVIDDITFNASRSNGTYGSSTTVQPSSARMTAFIKI